MKTTAWVCRTAWRDSRGSRKRLLLAISAITFGVAALVAITAFGANIREAVNNQAKLLLGADLVLSSRQPFAAETEALIASLGGEQSREISCSSMAYFPKSAGTRLVQVRALEGHFPYYGTLETEPPAAARIFHNGPRALVDDGLLLQFDAQVGDTIKIGTTTFEIAGRLKKIPGEAAAAALIGPRVYIPMTALLETGLIQKGSRLTYKVFFKLPKETDTEQLLETLRPHLSKYRLEGDTVQKRAASVGRVMTNLTHFLNLTGFIALLLGSVGAASAIHVYIKEKLNTVAILRCVGAQPRQTLAVYLVQAAALGLLGSVGGAGIGVAVQTLLPLLLRDFLPVRIPLSISWSALLQGFALGAWITLLFALLPLLSVRRVSPLLALRSSYEDTHPAAHDPLRWLLFLLIVLSICAFAFTHTERLRYGLGFCLALGVAFVLLAAVAKLLMVLVRVYCPDSWPYVWRQGLANLYRPHNQTLVLLLALGLGTFLLASLYLSQQMLLRQAMLAGQADQPNLVLFDIQSDQREGVANLVRSFALPVLQQAPLVTMRLASIKGRSVEDLRNDTGNKIPPWALQWEYRATYREHLIGTETVIAGTWQGVVDHAASAIPVSLEEEIAHTLGVTLGDELVFDVQGVPVTTTVGSIRKVDWQRVQPNFFVVFPSGILETAPQTYVLVSRVPANDLSAAVQRTAVQTFPNVSAVDLTLVLHTLDAILGRIAFAIRFMAFFSMAAGIMVLASAVITGRYQRLQESVLLRTLGASRVQIRQILLIEYLFLGSLAALTGLLLAVVASWALAYYLFETTFVPAGLPLVLALLFVIGLTIFTGVLGNRGVVSRPPLEVLRSDS
jgi:putative ABC transport system permease protein